MGFSPCGSWARALPKSSQGNLQIPHMRGAFFANHCPVHSSLEQAYQMNTAPSSIRLSTSTIAPPHSGQNCSTSVVGSSSTTLLALGHLIPHSSFQTPHVGTWSTCSGPQYRFLLAFYVYTPPSVWQGLGKLLKRSTANSLTLSPCAWPLPKSSARAGIVSTGIPETDGCTPRKALFSLGLVAR